MEDKKLSDYGSLDEKKFQSGKAHSRLHLTEINSTDFYLKFNKSVDFHRKSSFEENPKIVQKQMNMPSATSIFYDEFLGHSRIEKNDLKSKNLKETYAKIVNYIPFNNTFGKGNLSLKKFAEGSTESLKPSDIILNSIEVNDKQMKNKPKSETKMENRESLNFTLRNQQSFSSIKYSKKENLWESTLKSKHSGTSNVKNSACKSSEKIPHGSERDMCFSPGVSIEKYQKEKDNQKEHICG